MITRSDITRTITINELYEKFNLPDKGIENPVSMEIGDGGNSIIIHSWVERVYK